jgi:hypothetical protein
VPDDARPTAKPTHNKIPGLKKPEQEAPLYFQYEQSNKLIASEGTLSLEV